MALTKAEVAAHLSEEIGLSKREAKEFVESFFEEIKSTLESGSPVKISGFGGFELISSKTRNTDIVALNDTSIIVITKKGFGLLVKKFRDS